MFARKADESLASFARQLDDLVAQNQDKKAKGTVILLVDDKASVAPALTEIAKDKGLKKVPLTVAKDGEGGPPAYDLAKDVPVTIVVYDKTKSVTACFALDKLDAKAQSEALAAFAKVLGVDPPKVDEKKEAPKADAPKAEKKGDTPKEPREPY